MKTHIRRQQHKNLKHQDIKQKEPPQKYRLGTISNTQLLAGLNRFYMAIKIMVCGTNHHLIMVVLRDWSSRDLWVRHFLNVHHVKIDDYM